jgi:hypothetical protein
LNAAAVPKSAEITISRNPGSAKLFPGSAEKIPGSPPTGIARQVIVLTPLFSRKS